MEACPELPMGVRISGQVLQELVGSDIVFECQWGEISPFFIVPEMIRDDNARDAAGIQSMYDSAPNETRRARYEEAA
jgi:hypothetical protein